MTVRNGIDPTTGKPDRPTKTVKVPPGDDRDREAEKQLALFVAEVTKNKHKKPSKITVRQLAERFLRDNPDLDEDTKENYKIYLDDRILPALGDNKIDKVKPTHIYDFLNNLKEDGIRKDGKPGGLAPSTIQKYFHIISAMFTFAVDLGELKENPCSKVKPPKIPKRKPVSLDKDPAVELLAALKHESLKYKCITLIAATTGERRGEIIGIGDSTLDLDSCIIDVSRAIRHAKGRVFLKNPKTETSTRTVPFPMGIVPLLKEMIAARDKQRGKCGDKWVDKVETQDRELIENDLLFTQWNGKPMHPNTVDTWWAKFRERNNLPETLKFHGLRHTNITQLLKAGVDVGTVSNNAGHAKTSTTLDVYDDPLPSVKREVADKISNVLKLDETMPKLLGLPINIRHNSDKENQDKKEE
jgi:integrase